MEAVDDRWTMLAADEEASRTSCRASTAPSRQARSTKHTGARRKERAARIRAGRLGPSFLRPWRASEEHASAQGRARG